MILDRRTGEQISLSALPSRQKGAELKPEVPEALRLELDCLHTLVYQLLQRVQELEDRDSERAVSRLADREESAYGSDAQVGLSDYQAQG